MSDLELIQVLFNFGAPTIICLATLKYLATGIKELTKTVDACTNKMDKLLEKVERAIEYLPRRDST